MEHIPKFTASIRMLTVDELQNILEIKKIKR
jgi:hypothetical protein